MIQASEEAICLQRKITHSHKENGQSSKHHSQESLVGKQFCTSTLDSYRNVQKRIIQSISQTQKNASL